MPKASAKHEREEQRQRRADWLLQQWSTRDGLLSYLTEHISFGEHALPLLDSKLGDPKLRTHARATLRRLRQLKDGFNAGRLTQEKVVNALKGLTDDEGDFLLLNTKTKLLRVFDGTGYTNPATEEKDRKMPRSIKRAGKALTKRKPPSHQPGYQRKDRIGKVGLMVQLAPEHRAAIHAAAKESGCESTQVFVTQVLIEVAQQYSAENPNKPSSLSKAVKKQRADSRAAMRAAALRLATDLK